eukprot:TRINITY_DN25747_c0_g1_i1.p1 TRINITY_DN25747_c0_g1~~TRINITY_DN25747_c0_g1_i1.p1  ORF type:complete len:238 (+),score=98.35 TRINITY_DN25747_c0_g1_i1:109-822(+)
MKRGAKHKKELKKSLSFYKLHYGVRPPYKVLVDESFLASCSRLDLNPRHAILLELDEKMTPIVTPEILREVKDTKDYEAIKHAKTFFFLKEKKDEAAPVRQNTMLVATEQWKERPVTPGGLSIKKWVGKTNPEHYMVATNDKSLRRDLGNVPGVPLLHVDEDQKKVMLSAVGKASHYDVHRANEGKKTAHLGAADESFVKSMHDGEEEAQPAPRKRKQKGCNPLANKKKKRKMEIRA